jgi:hypothetical protein
MMLNRAATLLGTTLLMAATLSTAEAAADEKKDGRKTKGIFGKLMEKTHGNAAGANAGGEILAEDEEYWERFLQATVDSIPSASPSAPPTPGPQCDVSVSFLAGLYLIQSLSWKVIEQIDSL